MYFLVSKIVLFSIENCTNEKPDSPLFYEAFFRLVDDLLYILVTPPLRSVPGGSPQTPKRLLRFRRAEKKNKLGARSESGVLVIISNRRSIGAIIRG